MKKIIASIFLAALTCSAQIQYVDTATPHTSWQTNSYSATLTALTNGTLTVWRMNTSLGDSLPTAFGKVNSNFQYVYTNAASGSASAGAAQTSLLFATNGVITGTNVWGIFTNIAAFIASSSSTNHPLTNWMSFDGTNYQPYFVTNVINQRLWTNVTVNYFGTNTITNSTVYTNYFVAPQWLASSGNSATSTVSIYATTIVPPFNYPDVFTNYCAPPANTNTPVGWILIPLSQTNSIKIPAYL